MNTMPQSKEMSSSAVSSRTSRTAASIGSSPGSTRPFGKSQFRKARSSRNFSLRSTTLTMTAPQDNLVVGAADMQDLLVAEAHCTRHDAGAVMRLMGLINIGIWIDSLYHYESQGPQVSGGIGRHRAFRQGGRTDLREPADPVGPAQEAGGISGREAGGAPTEQRAAHGRGQGGGGPRAAHAGRERGDHRFGSQQHRSLGRQAANGADPNHRTVPAPAGHAEDPQDPAEPEPHAVRASNRALAQAAARRRNRSWHRGAADRSGRSGCA